MIALLPASTSTAAQAARPEATTATAGGVVAGVATKRRITKNYGQFFGSSTKYLTAIEWLEKNTAHTREFAKRTGLSYHQAHHYLSYAHHQGDVYICAWIRLATRGPWSAVYAARKNNEEDVKKPKPSTNCQRVMKYRATPRGRQVMDAARARYNERQKKLMEQNLELNVSRRKGKESEIPAVPSMFSQLAVVAKL